MTTIDEAAPTVAPEVPARESARPPWTPRRVVGFFLLLALALGIATTIYAGPVATSCDTTIFGAPGDATAGGVYTAWAYEDAGVGPWPSSTEYSSAPFGEEAWQPYFLSALLVQAPVKALGLVFGPVCSWNVAVFSGFVLSGLAMAGLALYITGDAVAATFAAFAFAFMPSRFARATGHIAYVHTELIPILLLALLFLCARPSWRRAALAGAALALLGYTDGYYILLGSVTFAAAALVVAVPALCGNQLARSRLIGLVMAGAFAVVMMLPLAGVFVGGRDDLTTAITRDRAELDAYGARPYEYLLPSRSHPVFDEVFGSWQDDHLHGSNYVESTLYVGWVALVLAGGALVHTWRRRRERDDPIPATIGRRFTVRMLATVGGVAFLFSLPATIRLLGLEVPGPSSFVYAFIKYWRVYARFGYVVHVVVIALAAIGLATLLARRSSWLRIMTVLALLAVVLFEFLIMPPRETWSYEQAAGVYRWLEAEESIDTIAEYPLYTPAGAPNGEYATFQPVHKKKMVNARFSSSDWDGVHAGIFGLGDEQTLPVLRALGVDAVVVHRGLYSPSPTEPIPAGLELEKSFTYEQDAEQLGFSDEKFRRWAYLTPFHNVEVYSIEPGPVAEVAADLGAGFHQPDAVEWRAFRWMQDDATFSVRRLGGEATEARVSFVLSPAFAEPREVEITQGDETLWSGAVTGTTPVEFVAAVDEPVTVRTTPGDQVISDVDPASTDPRSIAIGMSELVVEPVGSP